MITVSHCQLLSSFTQILISYLLSLASVYILVAAHYPQGEG